ncbi:MAG: type II secretion system protein M [Dokdonella sp.]
MIAAWWSAQSTRDQRILIVGAIVVAVVLLWAAAWDPLAQRRIELEGQLDGARRDLALMRVSEAEIERLRSVGTRTRADRQGRSLLALADASARSSGLDGVLKRIEPVGPRSVRASFEFAAFDSLISWLESLSGEYGIQVSDFSADRVDAAGLVNARITLEDVP